MGSLASKTPGQKHVQKLWLIWSSIINMHAVSQIILGCIRFWVSCACAHFFQSTQSYSCLALSRIALAESQTWKFLQWKRVLLISCCKTTGVYTEGGKLRLQVLFIQNWVWWGAQQTIFLSKAHLLIQLGIIAVILLNSLSYPVSSVSIAFCYLVHYRYFSSKTECVLVWQL